MLVTPDAARPTQKLLGSHRDCAMPLDLRHLSERFQFADMFRPGIVDALGA